MNDVKMMLYLRVMLISVGHSLTIYLKKVLTSLLWEMKKTVKIIFDNHFFGNYFFSLFSVFKNNFLFLRLKNLFGNSKWAENKNCFQNSICEGN